MPDGAEFPGRKDGLLHALWVVGGRAEVELSGRVAGGWAFGRRRDGAGFAGLPGVARLVVELGVDGGQAFERVCGRVLAEAFRQHGKELEFDVEALGAKLGSRHLLVEVGSDGVVFEQLAVSDECAGG